MPTSRYEENHLGDVRLKEENMRIFHVGVRVMLLVFLVTFTENFVSASDSLENWKKQNMPETSEEFPPALCPAGKLASGVFCRGKYCDNVGLTCEDSSLRRRDGGEFTSYFSEEFKGFMQCPPKTVIAGFVCKGKYCDNVALWCAYVSPKFRTDIKTTKSVSEEQGGKLNFGNGRFAFSMRCYGKYCDNKKFRTGRLTNNTN
jgi:hypothetical protein